MFNAKQKDFAEDIQCDGRWITVKGHHICIKKGQSVEEGIKEYIEYVQGLKQKAAKEQKERILSKVERIKKLKGDTEDAYGKVGPPKKPGLRTGTPGAQVSGAKRTKIGQKLKQKGIKLEIEKGIKPLGPDKFGVPFTVYNSETGMIVFGERVENTLTTQVQMTPVSSSNVKAVGLYNEGLLVQFFNQQGTFKYSFANPETAKEAFESLSTSGSPGRWVWENLRGHVAGETVQPTKIGPSIINKIPTIGGTSASLVQYELLGRSPIGKAQGFEKMSKLMRRKTSNPATDPNTGSRIEGLLGARKGFRELGKKIRQDFKKNVGKDIKVGDDMIKGKYIGNLTDFTLQKVVV